MDFSIRAPLFFGEELAPGFMDGTVEAFFVFLAPAAGVTDGLWGRLKDVAEEVLNGFLLEDFWFLAVDEVWGIEHLEVRCVITIEGSDTLDEAL